MILKLLVIVKSWMEELAVLLVRFAHKSHFKLNPAESILPMLEFFIEPELVLRKPDGFNDRHIGFLNYHFPLVTPSSLTDMSGFKNVVRPRSLNNT